MEAIPPPPHEKRTRSPEYYARVKERRAKWTEEQREKAREYRRKYKNNNREKIRKQNRAWEKANPDKVKEKNLRRDFGIGLAEYEALLNEQGNKCAICGSSEPGGKSKGYFHVDHDHRTGKVRGLLCVTCNIGLGYFGDEPERLESALNYLRRGNG